MHMLNANTVYSRYWNYTKVYFYRKQVYKYRVQYYRYILYQYPLYRYPVYRYAVSISRTLHRDFWYCYRNLGVSWNRLFNILILLLLRSSGCVEQYLDGDDSAVPHRSPRHVRHDHLRHHRPRALLRNPPQDLLQQCHRLDFSHFILIGIASHIQLCSWYFDKQRAITTAQLAQRNYIKWLLL